MKINYLADSWLWLGRFSGYHQLPRHISNMNIETDIVAVKYGLTHRLVGRFYSLSKGWFLRKDSFFAAAEYYFSRKFNKNDLFHVLYFDNHYRLWKRWDKSLKNVITTIHHPSARILPLELKETLKRVSHAIILTSRDLDYFENIIGKGRVRFIHHGVDTDFFYPKPQDYENKHLLFTGQNGRNNDMLYRIISKLTSRHPELYFDLLVPERKRDVSGLVSLKKHPKVIWHEGLTDEALRDLYQASYLLLQPMEEASANNAIVESLACGLPIVTTDVGGIRDYGGNSIFPVVNNNDDDSMIGLVEKYLSNPAFHNDIARKCREFAENTLAWVLVAKKHLEFYEDLIG